MFQTSTVNKQDYPFGHARKSYHIGAGDSDCVTLTKAIRLTGGEEAMCAQTNIVFLLFDTHWLLFFVCADVLQAVTTRRIDLLRHEACNMSNSIVCQILIKMEFAGWLHYTTNHFSVMLSQNVKS